MGGIFKGADTRELVSAYGVITDATDRAKARRDESAMASYLATLTQGKEIDPETPDYNPIAHHKAMVAHNTAVQGTEAVKQQKMQTMTQQIKGNHEKFNQAFQLSNTARAHGDVRRAQDILLGSYNDLYPNGEKLGRQGDKIVSIGPDGTISDSEVTDEEMQKMAKQMVDPNVYAQSYIGEYAKIKAHNSAILANPEEVRGPGGQVALKISGLLNQETGDVDPTYYIYKGVTQDENWARENGFETTAQSKDRQDLTKGEAEIGLKQAQASVAGKDAKNYEEDRALAVADKQETLGLRMLQRSAAAAELENAPADRELKTQLTKSQIKANEAAAVRQEEGSALTDANKTTPFVSLSGKRVALSNTEASQLKIDADAATENVTGGTREITPQMIYNFNELLTKVPKLSEYLKAIPNEKDKAKRKAMEEAVSVYLTEQKMPVLADYPSDLYNMISKRGSTNE